jgi:hypothetical protein
LLLAVALAGAIIMAVVVALVDLEQAQVWLLFPAHRTQLL